MLARFRRPYAGSFPTSLFWLVHPYHGLALAGLQHPSAGRFILMLASSRHPFAGWFTTSLCWLIHDIHALAGSKYPFVCWFATVLCWLVRSILMLAGVLSGSGCPLTGWVIRLLMGSSSQ